MDAWITEELRFAPEGLSHGWFISNLEFYDLQDSLSGGTLVAMALSVAVAFSVMLLTTWNVIISLYAILSIAGTIFVTVGSLVLLGWELNVLESVTISVAVGLSVDFAVHYGVAYRLAPFPDREGKVVFSLSRMGSAIAMAALTTFVAGAMMMPSTVLAYTQLGMFMMLIMCISWAFATFFFQCMCRCMGPQGTCGQIPLPKKLQCQTFSKATSVPPSQANSPALGTYQLGGEEVEHYELEPLASGQKTEAKPQEHELGTELFNRILPHHHAAPFLHVHCKSADTDGSVPENGLVATLSPPSSCQYSQNANCTCEDPPLHSLQQRTPQSCTQPLKDSLSCPPISPLFHHSGKHNKALLPPNLDPVYTHMECRLHLVHCPLTHFHHCSQGRPMPPMQGPVHTCHLRKHSVHLKPLTQNQDTAPAPTSEEMNPLRLSNCQNVGQSTPPPTQCPHPSAHTSCPNKQKMTDCEHCHGEHPASTTTTDLTARTSARNVPGNQEMLENIPVTRAKSVKKCKENSKRERASSASPKKLYCFNRTLKVKCNSASGFNVPKSEAGMPPVIANTNPSSESLC